MSKPIIYDAPFRALPIEIKLSEGEELPKRVQLLRTCTFFHKKYGKVDITRKLFAEMIKNFDKKVRRIDPAIDYAHKSDEDAAGWVTQLSEVFSTEKNEWGLWADVDWTPGGRTTLSEKKFRYLSADFDMNYIDNENPTVKHGVVLLGAGLTNRPVIKGMEPLTAIQLSELYKENSMTEEEIKAAEDKLQKLDQLMKELGVSSAEELMSKIAELKSTNTSLTEATQLAERTAKTDKLFAERKISKAQADEMVKLTGSAFDSSIKLAEMNTPMKEGDIGHGNKGTGTKTDKVNAQDKVIELAEERSKKDKISFNEAIKLTLSENKELKEAYYSDESEVEIEVEEE